MLQIAAEFKANVCGTIGTDGRVDGLLLDSELERLEADPSAWAKYFFPKRHKRDDTAYQAEYYRYLATFSPGAPPKRPRVECEPRGIGKSTMGRTGAVYLLARKVKRYILIVSATDNQAQKHFSALKRQLETPELLRQYPHLRPRQAEHRRTAANWSAQRIVTSDGQVVEFISILGNARGFNTEEGSRVDLIMVDDLDDQKDSVDVTEKKLDILASNILGAGDETTDVIYLQNLIHRTSICSRLRDNTAGILVNREFVGPYPLCTVVDWAEESVEGDMSGAKRYVVTDFQPYDPVTSREYVEDLLNRLGPKIFMRECQQDLSVVDEDKDFREWSEIHHVITYSEFYTYWKKHGAHIINETTGKLQIPANWTTGLGHDWGTTAEHPAAVIPLTRPNKATLLSDCYFVFGEVVLPQYPSDVNRPVEIVSPGRVAKAENEHLRHWNVAEDDIHTRLMSHEATAAQTTYGNDLQEDLKRHYDKWKAARGSGVPQLQAIMEIDYKQDHPFRRYPKNHPDPAKRGKPVKGRTRFMLLVPDEQGALKCTDAGHLYVAQPFNNHGCARLRMEIPIYSHYNQGKAKKKDDAVDALRGLAGEFVVPPKGITKDEEYQIYLNENAPELTKVAMKRIKDPQIMSLMIAKEREIRQLWEREHSTRSRSVDPVLAHLSEADIEQFDGQAGNEIGEFVEL